MSGMIRYITGLVDGKILWKPTDFYRFWGRGLGVLFPQFLLEYPMTMGTNKASQEGNPRLVSTLSAWATDCKSKSFFIGYQKRLTSNPITDFSLQRTTIHGIDLQKKQATEQL